MTRKAVTHRNGCVKKPRHKHPRKSNHPDRIRGAKNTCICPRSNTRKARAVSFYRTQQSPHSVQKIQKPPIYLVLRSLKAVHKDVLECEPYINLNKHDKQFPGSRDIQSRTKTP